MRNKPIFLSIIVIFFIFPSLAGAEEMHFFQAYQHMQKGEYQQAISGFKKALEQSSSPAPIYSNLAFCYEAEEMYPEAITCWEEYIKLNPLYVDRAKAHLLLIKDMQEAVTCLKQQRLDTAFPLLERVAKDTFPQSFIRLGALKWLTDYYFSQKEYNKVIDTTENILRNYKRTHLTVDNLFAYAQSLKKKGRVALARGYFQEIINLYPSFLGEVENSEYKLATAYFNLNRFKEAIEEYKFYLGKYPQGPLAEEAAYHLGLALKADFQYTEAIDTFRSVQKKYPNCKFISIAQYQIGLCYQIQGDKDRALKQYQDVIENYPKENIAGDAHFQIGRIFLEQDEKERAHREFRLLINRYLKASKTPDAIYILAEDRFNKIDRLNSVDWQESNLRYYDEVITHLSRIIHSYSSYPYSRDTSLKAQRLIMQCYERQARYDKKGLAYDMYLKMLFFLDGPDKVAEELIKTGDAHFAQSEFFEAKKHYMKLIKMFSHFKKSPYIYYRIAESYKKMGAYDKAITNYGKVFTSSKGEEELAKKTCVGIINSFDTARKYPRMLISSFNAEQEYLQVIQVLKFFLKRFPQSKSVPTVRFYLGYFYYCQKDYHKAKKTFLEFTKRHSGDSRNYLAKIFLKSIERIKVK